MKLDLDIVLAQSERDLRGVAHALARHRAGDRLTAPPGQLPRKAGDLVTVLDLLNLVCLAIILGGLGTIALVMFL